MDNTECEVLAVRAELTSTVIHLRLKCFLTNILRYPGCLLRIQKPDNSFVLIQSARVGGVHQSGCLWGHWSLRSQI